MPTENRSSNTEMVSVPRELLETTISCAWDFDKDGTVAALQDWVDNRTEQHQDEPVAFRCVAPDADFSAWHDYHEDSYAAALVDVQKGLLSRVELAYAHADPAEVERLRAAIEQQKNLIESLRAELVESNSIDASAEPCAPELTSDLREILGRPNFTCHFIAKALRVMGHSIASKSEDEQAVVIHWLLGIYLKHGPDWRQRAAAELEEASQSLST